MAISGSESQLPPLKVVVPSTEAEFVKCDSCGFTEECTPEYISRVREKYHGLWICGLCVEAVKDEVKRSERVITTEEALNRHISFCKDFRSFSPPNATEHPISAIGRLFRRSLDSPRSLPSTPSGDVDVPPESCFIEWQCPGFQGNNHRCKILQALI